MWNLRRELHRNKRENRIYLKKSIRHRAVRALKFRQGHHIDRVPRASFQKCAIRPLAGAQFASNAQNRIHHDLAERWMLLIRHPEHAIRHRTILHARRRPRTTRAHFIDYCDDMRLAFAASGRSFGNRVAFLYLAVHELRDIQGKLSQRTLRPAGTSHILFAWRGEVNGLSRRLALNVAGNALPRLRASTS
jgi:hypothetical protein